MGFPVVPLARQLPHVGFPRSPCPPVGPGVFLHCSPASCPTWASQQTPANSFLYSPCYVVCRAVKAGCHQDPLRSSVAKRSSVWNEELMALCRQQAWELGGTTVSATWMEFPAFGPWAGAPMLQLASFSQPYRLLLSFYLRAFLLVIVQRWAVAKNPCFLWCIPAPRLVSLRPSAFASAPLVLDSDLCRSRLCRHSFAFGSRRARKNYAGVGELRRVFSSVSRGDSHFFLLMTESGSVVVTDFGIATYVCNLEGVARTWC